MTTLLQSLEALYTRELTTLRAELEAYPNEADLWKTLPGMSNSGGNLALHLTGNLQHFIGAVLGKSGYVRNRDADFGSRNVARAELLQQVDQAIAVVSSTLRKLDPARLEQQFPDPIAKMRLATGDFLMHLGNHFSYHLGQLDYHRRAVTGGGPVAGALSPTKLASAVPDPNG